MSAPLFIELEAAPEPPAASPPPPPAPAEPPRDSEPVHAPIAARNAPAREMESSPVEASSDPETSETEPVEAEAAPLLTDPMAGADWSLRSGGGNVPGGGLAKSSGPGGARRAAYLAPRDFSRDPTPPNLLPLVRRNYPSAAKMYGYEGTVRVSLLVHSDGSVSDVKVEDADPSGRGFGEACTRTMLQGGAWKPRLDRNGRPMDSTSEFTCPFRL